MGLFARKRLFSVYTGWAGIVKGLFLHYICFMYSTYTLNTDELSSQFISVLQNAYPNQKVEIVVQEAQDETEYLLKDTQLLKAVQDIKDGENLVSVPLESL